MMGFLELSTDCVKKSEQYSYKALINTSRCRVLEQVEYNLITKEIIVQIILLNFALCLFRSFLFWPCPVYF